MKEQNGPLARWSERAIPFWIIIVSDSTNTAGTYGLLKLEEKQFSLFSS
jgi:hypothetical protein